MINRMSTKQHETGIHGNKGMKNRRYINAIIKNVYNCHFLIGHLNCIFFLTFILFKEN